MSGLLVKDRMVVRMFADSSLRLSCLPFIVSDFFHL